MVDPGFVAEVEECFGRVLGPSICPESRREAMLGEDVPQRADDLRRRWSAAESRDPREGREGVDHHQVMVAPVLEEI